MRTCYPLLAIFFIASAATEAQVVPAVTPGPTMLPVISGTLHFDLRYSQTAQFYNNETTQSAVASGDAAYASPSLTHPTTLVYSGGDMWNFSGNNGESGVFQHLAVSQGVLMRHCTFSVSDDVSYMPQSPTTGFSGIPGVGSLPSSSTSSQSILTLNSRSVYNTVNASYTQRLNHATSLSLNGSYEIMRFPDNNGLESNQWEVGPQITRRLTARNSIFGQYSYSRSSYPGYTITMETQSLQFGGQRQWSRRFSTSASAGPEWVHGSDSAQIPSSSGLEVNANATYQAKSTTASLSYSQATQASAGALASFGTRNYDTMAGLTRQFGRDLSVNATAAYMRTRGLDVVNTASSKYTGVTNSEYGGVSATRKLGRYFDVFASYTASKQLSSSALSAKAIHGVSQTVTFGIGYSPREMHFRK
jgi:hypothetical protein